MMLSKIVKEVEGLRKYERAISKAGCYRKVTMNLKNIQACKK